MRVTHAEWKKEVLRESELNENTGEGKGVGRETGRRCPARPTPSPRQRFLVVHFAAFWIGTWTRRGYDKSSLGLMT